jgi:catechol 2,3-dioxygenase-like lactoylglutathione lyase family enzyme
MHRKNGGVHMENLIANLLKRYESGKLARRELVQGLALLVASAGQSKAAVEIANINHVSLQVSDLQRSSQFYQKVFGVTVINQANKDIIQLKVGKSHITLRKGVRAGVVDHFAIGVDGFNEQTTTQLLKERGANPSRKDDVGWHVLDPDGYPVQIIGSDA